MNDDVTETEQSLRIPYRKPVYFVRYKKSWYDWRSELMMLQIPIHYLNGFLNGYVVIWSADSFTVDIH